MGDADNKRFCSSGSTSRIVAFSSGNVYGFVPPSSRGATETDATDPVGEYAQSCLGRERVFEHFSRERGTPGLLFRLFYAVDLRYGTIVDIARHVQAGEPVDLSVGRVNAIWQGDACAMSLESLACTTAPPIVVNIAGPELLSVRRLAQQLGGLLQRPVTFAGSEAADALLSNVQLGHRLFGYPRVSVYYGSWAEWGTATETPVETGAVVG